MPRLRTLFALLFTVAFAAGIAVPAGAQSLDDAEKQLTVLESQILQAQQTADAFQKQLTDLAAQIATEQGNLDEIRDNLAATDKKVSATQARLGKLKGQVQVRARELYKQGGPLQMIGVLMGAESMRDLVGRASYASSVAKHDESLVLDTRSQSAELENIRRYQQTLETSQNNLVSNLRRRQDAINDVFAKQQVALADLAKARSHALDVIASLEAKLGASALAGLKRVAGQGMTVSYGEWADAFLRTVGAPVVRNNLVVMVAWEAAEGTQATWNPLATTMDADGATAFNTSGVKNYPSEAVGVDATIRTLRRPNHGYEDILDGLERAPDPMETGHAIQQSDWCHGCAEGGYVVGIIPAVEQYYDQYAGA